MSIRTYSNYGTGTDVQFIGLKTLLDRAGAFGRMEAACDSRKIGRNQGASVNLRRWVNPSVKDTGETEGVTPVSRALVAEDYTGTMTRYSDVFESSAYSSELSVYDDVEGAVDVMKDQIARTRERIRFNAAVAGVGNVAWGGGATSRAAVDGPITVGLLQNAIRSIEAAKGMPFTQVNNGDENVGTRPIEAGHYCYVHTDTAPDIRNLSGFTKAAEFGGGLGGYPAGTFGAVDNVIFVTTPEAIVWKGAGGDSTGAMLETSSKTDVYPFILVSKHALTSIALAGNGRAGFGNAAVMVNDKPDKSDPTNTRRQVAAAWYDLCMITAQEWLYRIECGTTASPT